MEALIVIAVACVAAVSRHGQFGEGRGTPAGSVADSRTRGQRARAGRRRGAGRQVVRPAAARGPNGRGARPRLSTRPRTRRCASAGRRCCAWRSASCSARSRSRRGIADLSGRERALSERMRDARAARGRGWSRRRSALALELERVAGMTRAQARQALLREVEEEARHEKARVVRQVEEEARREADAPVAQHPLGVHAAARRRPRGGDDRVARRRCRPTT